MYLREHQLPDDGFVGCNVLLVDLVRLKMRILAISCREVFMQAIFCCFPNCLWRIRLYEKRRQLESPSGYDCFERDKEFTF